MQTASTDAEQRKERTLNALISRPGAAHEPVLMVLEDLTGSIDNTRASGNDRPHRRPRSCS
jgi:hypothetical protein